MHELLQPQSLRSTRTDQFLVANSIHDTLATASAKAGAGAITPILYPSSGLPDRFGSPKREQWRPWATSRMPLTRSQSHSRLHSRSHPIHGCPSSVHKSQDKETLFEPEGRTVVWKQEPPLAEVSMVGIHIPSPIEQALEAKRLRKGYSERKGGQNCSTRRDVSLKHKLRVLKSRNQATFPKSHTKPRPPALLQELAQYITRRTQHDVRGGLAALPLLNYNAPTMSVAVAKTRRKTIKEFLAKLRNAPPPSAPKDPKDPGRSQLSFGALLPCRGVSYGNLNPGRAQPASPL